MQAHKPWSGAEWIPPYGSVFHWHEDQTKYTPEMLKKWSNRELIIKHYHLTARLDGYGYLSATQVQQDNCLVFREALAERGIDGVKHCIQMDMYYDWGHREVQVFYPKLDEPLDMPETRFVYVGL